MKNKIADIYDSSMHGIDKKHIPELRFPEFANTEEWEEKQLNTIGETFGGLSGKSAKDFGEGEPYVTYKQVFAGASINFDECQFVHIQSNESQNKLQQGDVLITMSSETPNEIGYSAVVTSKPLKSYYLNSFCFIFRYKNSIAINPLFSIYLFQSNLYRTNVIRIAQGITRYNISPSKFLDIKLSFPSLAEQQKIAGCLSAIDEQILATQQKWDSLKEYKRGLMQKLFPANGKTTPDFRFPEFANAEEWEEKKLGEILIERKEWSVITKKLPQLSFTITEGVIRPEERKTNQRDFLMNDKDNKRFAITRLNDIIYNPANVIYGAIHKNNLCDGVVSPIYKVFWTKENANFLNYLVRRSSFISRMATHAEGTVTKLKTLKSDAFLDLLVPFPPSPAEQKKIADCLSALDEMIAAQAQKTEALKEHKRGLMQKLFPIK